MEAVAVAQEAVVVMVVQEAAAELRMPAVRAARLRAEGSAVPDVQLR